MIKRQELINDILDVYEHVDTLERENEELKPYACVRLTKNEDKNSLTDTDYKILEIGKKEVLERSLYSFKCVWASYDEVHGRYSVTPYLEWLKNKQKEIPSFMSFDEFVIYFGKELRDMYQKERREAIERAKKENE